MQHDASKSGRFTATHSLFSIHPDETLYSWCAANHAMSCCRNSAATASELLGAAHAVRQHEFPHSLERFTAISKAEPASCLGLLRDHSVAGFYLPFLSAQAQKELAYQALHPQSTHWMRAVLGSSRTQQVTHPLKWCCRCMQHDIENIGRPLWHTVHQYPTAVICTQHNEPLRSSYRRRKQWRLPSKEDGIAIVVPDALSQLASNAAALGSHLQRTPCIDMLSLRRSAICRLQEIGVIHSANGMRHERIARWFSSTGSSSLVRIAQPELNELIDGSLIPGLLWRKKKSTAIAWVVLWNALEWKSHHELIHSFADAASGRSPSIKGQLPLFNEFPTDSLVAPEYVRDAFQCCDSYADVMERLRVSRRDVVRWLEVDPTLRNEWKSRLRNTHQAECIERIRCFVQSAPQSRRADIENHCSADYRWMREHAPNQLAALMKSLGNRSSSQFRFEY
ncbi:TniQ family protein [Comamonas sp. MYb69]